METNEIMILSSNYNPISMNDFEEIFLASMRRYSMRHLPLTHEVSMDSILESVQKSLQVCQMAGIDGTHHFKKVFVYNADVQSVQIDWQMTKKGLNLMAMNTPEINQSMARWLCQMADL